MDVKAKSSIKLHLADNVMLNVDKDMNAKETWDKREKVYRGKTLSNKLFLKDDLLSLWMEEGGNLITIMFGKESLKLDRVMEVIQSYVKMDENTEGSQVHGLYAKGKERGQSQSRHDKSGNKDRSKSKGKEKENNGCFTCGAIDHWKKNCKIWHERKGKQRRWLGIQVQPMWLFRMKVTENSLL
ncbi:hypothetical protein LWI28_025284 [Acer negundo]|uniref:CCHC-type domain-containing protein n=1 Tax=Acer negundo TaxID=4023 RepID=A0AAD5JEL5_ACENE|nr:hypothetical protein LWI28_025284 [Acer negundo]